MPLRARAASVGAARGFGRTASRRATSPGSTATSSAMSGATARAAPSCAAVTIDDRRFYIYTSGTTGLPKAAKVSHHRVMMWSHWFAGMMDTRPDDRMYNCLPMYHSVGGVVAIGAVLVNGGSVVIREKFSARPVLGRRRALRLHAVPVHRRALPLPRERAAASARSEAPASGSPAATACGPTCGRRFKDRFGIPQILEFYAATEGNFSLYNVEGEPGAIGRVPPFLAHRFPDRAREVRRRAAARRCATRQGFCIRCAAGRGRRGDRPDRGRGVERRRPLRGLHQRAAIRRRRSCATCSSRAMPGFAPAT